MERRYILENGRYPGQFHLSFLVFGVAESGELLAIMGSSGAGKLDI